MKSITLAMTSIVSVIGSLVTAMKNPFRILIACFAFFIGVSAAHAEDLQNFLKRTGTGDATVNDLHENFHISVFVGGEAREMNRDELVKFWAQQKASGIKLAVDSCTIISQTETPNNDGKGSVISVVAKTSVTENVRGSIAKIESTAHFIVLRDSQSAFHLLYATVPKTVRQP